MKKKTQTGDMECIISFYNTNLEYTSPLFFGLLCLRIIEKWDELEFRPERKFTKDMPPLTNVKEK